MVLFIITRFIKLYLNIESELFWNLVDTLYHHPRCVNTVIDWLQVYLALLKKYFKQIKLIIFYYHNYYHEMLKIINISLYDIVQ